MVHLFARTEQYFCREEDTKAEERTVHRQQTDALSDHLRCELSIENVQYFDKGHFFCPPLI